MKSPLDDPKLLEDWKELHRYNTQTLGLSNRRSFTLIGQKYGYSRSGVQYWLEENNRKQSIQRKKDNLIPYSIHPRKLERREHGRIYQYVRRNLDTYVKQTYSGHDIALTLDQLTSNLFELTGISMRNSTFLKILSKYEQEQGKILLIPIANHEPTIYRLNTFTIN
ncbi:MAG: hypothetical protein V1837_06880 [Candidatus Woesearchaeota archaeon]